MDKLFEEFTRVFTEDEFQENLKQMGYDPIAEQYCRERLADWHNYHIKEEVEPVKRENEAKSSQEIIHEVLGGLDWSTSTVREEAWETFKRCEDVECYINQRKLGFGHDWASLFAYNSDDMPYEHAFDGLVENDKEELAKSEMEHLIAIFTEGKSPEYDKFLRYCLDDGRKDDAIKQYEQFVEEYQALIKSGKDKVYAYKRVELNVFGDYAEEYDEIYAKAYAREINKGKEEHDADNIAYEEAEAFSDVYFDRNWDLDDSKQFAERVTELISNGMNFKEAKKNAEDEILKAEELAYDALIADLIAEGMSESKAKKEAARIVSEGSCNTETERTKTKREEMLEVMYRNEDIYDDDFDDGLDLEDLYKD